MIVRFGISSVNYLDLVREGFGAQLISPIQLHVKRQISSLCIIFQDISWIFFLPVSGNLSFTFPKSEKITYLDNFVFLAFSIL